MSAAEGGTGLLSRSTIASMESPEFPLRIIFDDGTVEVIDSPDELLESVDSIDSGDAAARVWIRDQADRSVLLRMRHGVIEQFELV